jgi:hypothetical protein
MRAGVAALVDYAFDLPWRSVERTVTLWAIELLEHPDDLAPRLARSSETVFRALIRTMREYAGIDGGDD